MAKKKIESTLSFSYEGVDRKGVKIKGDIPAKNIALAKVSLRKQGIVVSHIKEKRKDILGQLFKRGISSLDITIFTRQLATMMRAGVPLVQGLDIVSEGLDNQSMRNVVAGIKSEVENGNTFAGGLRKFPQHFDQLFCSLVESGEQSGSLDTMLERVATYKEKSEQLKMKIKKALKYPIFVIIVAIAVTILLMIKVVPVFQDIFTSFGQELPLFTQMVVSMSVWMQNYWIAVVLMMIMVVIAFVQSKKRSKKFRDYLDKLSLKLPIFGDLIYKAIIARFSRTLSTTFAAGVPLIDALQSTAGATNNVIFENAVLKIKENVSTGQQLNFAMRLTNRFPTMAIQMVAIGEESGALDAMLEKVANYYEDEVDHAVDGLTSLLEPLIMVILGILVGGLVIAMYLPIFKMGSIF
ncbi:type II secretion system F family protein [Acinetobacter gerneri]|uniref:Type II secretion system F family protein n=1 Tax=Acinetobacter gerneri TaxID=202952 RepID=A0AAW8JM56_9GAMM|nr:type II secretion system F family protein [Acinetobacter gerneri]MDQ9010615.1 type II secretion system F family protein [Acinetobacter gerneri]MDQ9014814.1 type II secretion system F family protein [Acinetobacter gerneri]MDQ9025985.1 type II secretion system F family protein [Acinetobacter gerneri]MDQ9053263.1 type II secretion system F family protein [Acinetobacter gerneri]MDQ9060881.1 type II secretion system F family protein [Acinetobacter gerneri]